MSVLGPSIANYVRSNRALYNLVKPVANWYAQVAGYRQHGLRYDDLIDEESEVMQKAISRLSERDQYDRAYRMRVAMQLSVLHKELPKADWTSPENDKRYLTPLVKEIEAENAERKKWDSATLQRGH